MDFQHELEQASGLLGPAQPQQGLPAMQFRLHPLRFGLAPAFGHGGHLLRHTLGPEESRQIGKAGHILGSQKQQPFQDLCRPQGLPLLIQPVGPVPEDLHLPGNGVVGGGPAGLGGVQQLGADPEVAQGIAAVRLTEFLLDGVHDGLEPMLPKERQGHLHVGAEFTDEGFQGIPGPAQVQPEPDQLQSGLSPRLEGHPQGELPRIGVEVIQEQETQVGPHEPEVNKDIAPKVVDRTSTRQDDSGSVGTGGMPCARGFCSCP